MRFILPFAASKRKSSDVNTLVEYPSPTSSKAQSLASMDDEDYQMGPPKLVPSWGNAAEVTSRLVIECQSNMATTFGVPQVYLIYFLFKYVITTSIVRICESYPADLSSDALLRNKYLN